MRLLLLLDGCQLDHHVQMVVVTNQGALDLGLVPEADVQLAADILSDHLHGVFIVVHYKYIHNIDKDGRPNSLHIY